MSHISGPGSAFGKVRNIQTQELILNVSAFTFSQDGRYDVNVKSCPGAWVAAYWTRNSYQPVYFRSPGYLDKTVDVLFQGYHSLQHLPDVLLVPINDPTQGQGQGIVPDNFGFARGVVTNKNGKPLNGVTVKHVHSPGVIYYISSECTGLWAIAAVAGNQTIRFTMTGYQTKDVPISVLASQWSHYPVILE